MGPEKAMKHTSAKLHIRKARPSEWQKVVQFYEALIEGLAGRRYHPKWQKGHYPAPDDLRAAVEAGTLYIGTVSARIACAMVVNHSFVDAYRDAAWADLSPEEFLVIHMLGVHSDFEGRGYAKELVQHAIHLARTSGMQAVRLDVIQGNLPAGRLYSSLGFRHVETRTLRYEGFDPMAFELYEYWISA